MTEPSLKASFLYDQDGHKTHVLLPVDEYTRLVEVVEDAGLLRAMDETENDEVLTLERALAALNEV